MIVYYITSHGFGHTVRACEIIRNLPPEIPLTLRTTVPEWFLRQELGERPFALAPASFDCGVLGPDSLRIDLARTVDVMEETLARNEARLAEEVEYLRETGARVVVSDVPAFPLRAARVAGAPSVLVANFTWAGIYEDLAGQERDHAALAAQARAVAARMQAEYDEGELLLETDMSIGVRACRRRAVMPLVARHGINRRAALAERLALDPAQPIYLIYLGRDGLDGLAWNQRERLHGLQLVSYNPPDEAGYVVHRLPHELLAHADAAASVDAVIAKPGYGVAGECIAAGTRLLYLPRPEFAETAAFDDLMARWGGGLQIDPADFMALDWAPWLAALGERKINETAVDCTGGPACAAAIASLWRE